MADRKHDDEVKARPRKSERDDEHQEQPYTDKEAPRQHHQPPKQESQKSQIIQYFKSQNKQPDDIVWSVGGLNLTLKDLTDG